jgi:hypothetical protein
MNSMTETLAETIPVRKRKPNPRPVPAYNPRAERDKLVQFTSTLDKHAIHRLLLNPGDQTYQAALDYLDPDMPHIFIGNQAVRQALVSGCIAHIQATCMCNPATP